MRTIQQWAKDAAGHVQFASNLSGLVFDFERCVADLAVEAERLGKRREWVNQHPICVLWADKLDDLSRAQDLPSLPTDQSLVDLVPCFAQTMRKLCEESRRLGYGTAWRNRHPEAREFIRRIVYVTGSREGDRVFDAFRVCDRLSAEANSAVGQGGFDLSTSTDEPP